MGFPIGQGAVLGLRSIAGFHAEIAPAAVRFLACLEPAEKVFDLSHVFLRRDFAQENDGQAVTIHVELIFVRIGPHDLQTLGDGFAHTRMIGLARFEKCQTLKAFSTQTIVRVGFHKVKRTGDECLNFGALGREPGPRSFRQVATTSAAAQSQEAVAALAVLAR